MRVPALALSSRSIAVLLFAVLACGTVAQADPVPVPSSVQLRAVAWNGAGTGLAVGQGYETLRTTDGGATWTLVDGDWFDWGWLDVAWGDGDTVWAVGENAILSAMAGISHDGGKSWERWNVIQGDGRMTGVVTIDGVPFASASLPFGGFGAGAVYILQEGKQAEVALQVTEPLVDITLHGDDLLVVGLYGGTWTSADGGETWIQGASATFVPVTVALGVGFMMRAVEWVDEDVAVAVGDGGFAIRTTDGGLTWLPVTTGVSADLHGVAFAGGGFGYAVGAGGTALTTQDGGFTWAPMETETNTRLLDVTFDGAGGAWAVGDFGTVLTL